MKIDVSMRQLSDGGGLELGTLRLAQLLQERGHDVRLLYGIGSPLPEFELEYVRVLALAEGNTFAGAPGSLVGEFTRGGADIHITSCADEGLVRVLTGIAPTITYSLEHSAICPVGSKYWSTLQMACPVRAGAFCSFARPLLGCGQRRTSLSRAPLRRRKSYMSALELQSSRIWVPSTDLRSRFLHQGLSAASVAVMPNLGMRMSAAEMEVAAERAPLRLRDRVLFIGRLSKEKGASLLPQLFANGIPKDRLLCIGDGYLRGRLQPHLGDSLLPPTNQPGVASVLMWARGLVFPSLWPEPGGIVGIDAQLFGLPVAAFAVGAPLDWPDAALFSTRDVAALGTWASTLGSQSQPRDAATAAAAQRQYWRVVGDHAEVLLHDFVSGREWPADAGDPVRDALSN